MSRILCSYWSVRPTIPKNQPSILRQIRVHIPIILAAVHTKTHTPPAACSKPVILTVQSNSSFLYRLTIWFMALMLSSDLGHKKKRNHSITTFNGFIPLLQQCCHAEMAPCLVWGSACVMWMTQASGKLVSKGARCVGAESTSCLVFSSCIRFLEDECMFGGCEKRVAHKCSHFKQNIWPADI